MTDLAAFWEIVGLTLAISGAAILISAALGIPAGAFLGLARFPGRRWIVALVYTGMGLPPVVVGLSVYLLLSRSGPLGWTGWLFTPSAMVVAQVIISFPLVAGLTMTALEALEPELRLQLQSLGASPRQELIAMLGEAREGVIAAVVAGFGSIISEVGAAMLVGGNIASRTRILSTAIVLETRQGAFGLALALGGALLSLAFGMNVMFLRLQGKGRWLVR